MLELIAAVIKLLDKGLDKLPPAQRCDACRALELELARRRVEAKAQMRLDAMRKAVPPRGK